MYALETRGLTVRHRAQKFEGLKAFLLRGWRSGGRFVEALRGVDLAVEKGETLGIIGGNGAGKSTLLRTLVGIITPAAGVAITRGEVVPLIELSTGFELEFSGRENIAFSGALLGRSKAQMQAREEAIIEFSGLREVIDSPIRIYSTGMIARLAFAIAVECEADILLIDEVLSVGDAVFRTQAVDRIRSFVTQGGTLLVVSHDLDLIEDLCRRTLWLEEGEVRMVGATRDVLAAYGTSAGRR